MEAIKFTTNWNKKLETDNFTTIRLRNPYKYKLGEVYEIQQKVEGKFVSRGKGKIIQLHQLKLDQFKEIPCYLDTGYSLAETKAIIKKMYPKIRAWQQQDLYYMLIQKVKEKELPKSYFEFENF